MKMAGRLGGGLAVRSPSSTVNITPILASGATMAVTVTMIASSQAPCSQKDTGREIMVVSRRCPTMSTDRNGARTATKYRTTAVRLNASARLNDCGRVRRRVASHRRQFASACGGSGGSHWNNPQSGHSRSWSISGDWGAVSLIAPQPGRGKHAGPASSWQYAWSCPNLRLVVCWRATLQPPAEGRYTRHAAGVAQG